MQARFGEGFFPYIYLFILNFLIKEIIYSIRLVPGSSPGQPIIISIWKSCVYKSEIFNSFIQKKKIEKYR